MYISYRSISSNYKLYNPTNENIAINGNDAFEKDNFRCMSLEMTKVFCFQCLENLFITDMKLFISEQ